METFGDLSHHHSCSQSRRELQFDQLKCAIFSSNTGPASRAGPSQLAALGQCWAYLGAGLVSAFCLSSGCEMCCKFLLISNVSSRVKAVFSVADQSASCLQSMVISGICKISFVLLKQRARVRLQKAVKGCAW